MADINLMKIALIYDSDFRKFLGLINSEDNLEDIQDEEWWY